MVEVKLKSGRRLHGLTVTEWLPRKGRFTVSHEDGLYHVELSTVLSASEDGTDLLEKARTEGWEE